MLFAEDEGYMKDKRWRVLMFQSIFVLVMVLGFCMIIPHTQKNSVKEKVYADDYSEDMHDAQSEEAVRAKRYRGTIVIDAGHGGVDEGASVGRGRYREKDYNLIVVKRLKKLLDRTGFDVHYTRLEDKTVSKKRRTDIANNLKADLFISIHCNAAERGNTTAYGVEALYSDRKFKYGFCSSKKLAGLLVNNVSEKVHNKKRGVIKREHLYLLRHSDVAVSIIEIGYMSNKSDLNYIKDKEEQKKIAEGIYESIVDAYALNGGIR